jgi:hypothetical protein
MTTALIVALIVSLGLNFLLVRKFKKILVAEAKAKEAAAKVAIDKEIDKAAEKAKEVVNKI